MKATGFLKIAAPVMLLLLSSCASKKKAVVENKPLTTEQLATQDFIKKVGYPVIVKPDRGVGAEATWQLMLEITDPDSLFLCHGNQFRSVEL